MSIIKMLPLGIAYMYGVGAKQSNKTASHWLLMASKQKNDDRLAIFLNVVNFI